MSTTSVQLDAGGLLPAKTKVDADAAEQVVARSYRHPALGDRSVVRLASDRLGQAEDLAMEFLGFAAPAVSAPIAVQQRRSLGFAAWALINDPKNARYALDLVKRMKGAARQAKSKPGHAWDTYAEMAKDLGRSARHFLPPYWEEVGRAFKDLGNQTYAGRALSKSLEAERVHALESDRARRRDVVLEFVLSGCVAGSALSEYGNDLQSQYPPAEAFAIFRDLCVRRTRGGMSPWATMPKEFIKLAKAADLDGDRELEKFLEEVIEAPAMGRAPYQFWKTCSGHGKRIVARSPAFAVALLRHTRPEPRYYGESKMGPWFELLEEWGVFEYLWEEERKGAPSLGEPIAEWFGRIVRDDIPAPKRTLEMLEKLTPRLKKEKTPLLLFAPKRHYAGAVDIDVLEACLVLGIKVDDPTPGFAVTFGGWLSANVDHKFRNQDIVESAKDERFRPAILEAMDEALKCHGGTMHRNYRQSTIEQRAFPLAAGNRRGIKAIWHEHAMGVIAKLKNAGLTSFEIARARLESTLWPDTLRLFPDVAKSLNAIDPVAMLKRTLQAGVFDEYGLPSFEHAVEQGGLKIETTRYGTTNLHLTFPNIVVSDKVHATVIAGDGKIKKHELRLPKNGEVTAIVVVGDDLAVAYRDDKHQGHFHWVSDPATAYDCPTYFYHRATPVATVLKDGTVFLGGHVARPGDKEMPIGQPYFHDGERFWRLNSEYEAASGEYRFKVEEIDRQSGKALRQSVPPWLEEADGGTIDWNTVELLPVPPGIEDSPLGVKDGLLGWKTIKRRDGTYLGQGIDGREFSKSDDTPAIPVGMLKQPGTMQYLPVTSPSGGRAGVYWIWDPSASTVVATLQDFQQDNGHGQVTLLPLLFWHLLKVRDEQSSLKLRAIDQKQCAAFFEAAGKDRALLASARRAPSGEAPVSPLANLLPAVKKLLSSAPERMTLGIARVIERAERESAAFTTLRDKSVADSKGETKKSSRVDNRKCDLAAEHWGLRTFTLYGREKNASIGDHLSAVADFLKGDSKPGDLPLTNYLWFSMLSELPLRAWQTFWRTTAAKMTNKGSEAPWLEFLKHWHALGIAELPGQFDTMEGVPGGTKKTAWGAYDIETEAGTSYSLQNGDDKFIVLLGETYHHGVLPYQFLRYSTAKTPEPPPGYEVQNVRKINVKHDSAEVAAMIAAAESCKELPLPSPDELAKVASNVSASPAEVGLIWMGGLNLDTYQNNFLPGDLRTAWGWKTTEASAARQALRNLNAEVLGQLYDAVVANGGAAPFAADRAPVLREIKKAWLSKMPKRLLLDADLQRRLSAFSKHSRWANHEELLAIAADPTGHAVMQPREIEIKIDKERNYSSLHLGDKNKSESLINEGSLRSILQLVALVHSETATGHAARAGMPALIQQTTKLLEDSGTLLEVRTVPLHQYGKKKLPTPTEWLNQYVGKTKVNEKEGTARFDDGLFAAAAFDAHHQAFVAFRPAKLKDKNDLARLHGIVDIEAGQEYSRGGTVLPIVVAIRSSGFQKLAKAILAKKVPEGQWPQNPNLTAAEVVAAIRKKHKLGDDAAVLYAQLLALPDPTAANVSMWNGWTTPQYKKASAELVSRKLVLEATRARAGRSIFLPGEWLDLKAPWLPIETWKLAHLVDLDLDPREPCPAGGPLVLRPFEDLFAAAWQRIVDGDEPRYEEVKRKKKSK